MVEAVVTGRETAGMGTGERGAPAAPDPAACFVAVAEAFVATVQQHAALSAEAFLQRVQQQLPGLYAAGLQLPDAVPEEEEDVPQGGRSGEELDLLRSALAQRIGPERDLYAEVFDPYGGADEPAATGSLSDDLADIVDELRRGLASWSAGRRGEAVWSWRLGLTAHWGEHATGAMRALHSLAGRGWRA